MYFGVGRQRLTGESLNQSQAHVESDHPDSIMIGPVYKHFNWLSSVLRATYWPSNYLSFLGKGPDTHHYLLYNMCAAKESVEPESRNHVLETSLNHFSTN